jgi:hypothetical protein
MEKIETKFCPLCKDKVNSDGSVRSTRYHFRGAAWDWFNLEMLPMVVGPCKGCHEVKCDVLMRWLNLLVLLDILYPRPDWNKESGLYTARGHRRHI